MSKSRSHLSRKYGVRKERRLIYIFTEGTKTEKNYFESKKKEIRKTNVNIQVKGTGHNTLSLVDYALNFIQKNNISLSGHKDSDECWVVFDKDDFDHHFNAAVQKAEANDIKVAYSNESFELWYALHFRYSTAVLGRQQYVDFLNQKMLAINGKKYDKAFDDMYSLLKESESLAIDRAEKLLKFHLKERSHKKKNPSTTVHLLVKALSELS